MINYDYLLLACMCLPQYPQYGIRTTDGIYV